MLSPPPCHPCHLLPIPFNITTLWKWKDKHIIPIPIITPHFNTTTATYRWQLRPPAAIGFAGPTGQHTSSHVSPAAAGSLSSSFIHLLWLRTQQLFVVAVLAAAFNFRVLATIPTPLPLGAVNTSISNPHLRSQGASNDMSPILRSEIINTFNFAHSAWVSTQNVMHVKYLHHTNP